MAAVSPVLVGRAAEIAVLDESWARVRSGSPATVLIGGEAGIGKTRLVRQFTADVEAEVLYGGCVDLSGGGLPFTPFTSAMRGHGDTLAKLLPVDVQADSDTSRARLFEEVLTQFAGLCARRPVVLVIEDIHWIDRSSLDLLSFLVYNQQAAGALLCAVTYRSDELERTHPLRGSLAQLDRVTWTRRLELSRLERREMGSLIGAIAGTEPAASLVAEIYRRSEGNPFFAEVLLDRQDQPGLPESLRDLLLARVAQLPDPTQAVLRMAAAGVGRVGHELLAAASGLDDGALSAALRPAVAAGVLVVDGGGYRFRHALISEAVRDDQLPGERAAAHRRFAQALASGHVLAADGGGSAELAFHWHAAGDASRALVAEAAALIERSLADADLRRAERFAWPMLVIGARVAAAGAPGLLDELCRRAAETTVTGPVLHAQALTFAVEAGRAAGTVARARCDEAVAAWEGVGNPYQLARALIGAAEAAAAEGDRPAAAAHVRRAAEIAGRLGARPLREQAEWLARRARLTLAGDPATPAADPGEHARHEYGLTARELEVLRLLAAGRSNRDIAAELFISAKTASVHVSNIMAKLGVASRVEAAAIAYRLGLGDRARTT